MGDPTDIIAAIASGAGPAAIGVVRVSGSGAHGLALRVCGDLRDVPPERRLTRTVLVHPLTRRCLDEALVAFFRPGASYTGEEMVELFCHGGRVTLQRVLEACLAAGARAAAPGEFTRRAVASGRMDLLQAEAVALLTQAPTPEAADLAVSALLGEASRAVMAVRESLLAALAECEATLDFAEEDGVEVSLDGIACDLQAAVAQMQTWIEEARAARPAISGVRVALVGPPNAGKSSLFNAILGRDRAIVHEDPGTTRDVVTEPLWLAGVLCVLADTAGLRETPVAVEAEGVARAIRTCEEADVTVLVLDGSAGDSDCSRWPRADLVALNKADRWSGHERAVPAAAGTPVVVTSALTGAGIPRLRDAIAAIARRRIEEGRPGRLVIAGERQVEAVLSARQETMAALSTLQQAGPLEAVAARLRAGIEHLGGLTGANLTGEVLDRIFSQFCIGK